MGGNDLWYIAGQVLSTHLQAMGLALSLSLSLTMTWRSITTRVSTADRR